MYNHVKKNGKVKAKQVNFNFIIVNLLITNISKPP